MRPYIDSWLHLPLDHPQASVLKKELTQPNPAYDNAVNLGFSTRGIDRWVLGYEESLQNGVLKIPRAYVNSLKEEVDDHTASGLKTYLGKPIKLRPNQIGPADAIEAHLRAKTHGTVKAPPGSGKTVLGLEVARRFGVKVGVLVHQTFLMNQWKERIEQFLPGVKVGMVRQDRCEYDADIVLMMAQSIAGKDYPKELYERVGFLIVDEAHRFSAETFQRSIVKFPARYRLGLTATPDRADGMQWIFQGHLGKISAEMSVERETPQVYVVPSNLRYVANIKALMVNGKQNLSKVINFVADSPARNRQVVELVVQAAEKQRKVIVFSDRRQHLVDMAEEFKSQAKKAGVNATIGFFVGGMTEKDRAIASGRQVIFATYQFAKEGLDIAELDTCILATPKGDIIQTVGRIQRVVPGKPRPIVIDVVDQAIGLCSGLARKRQEQYFEQGWEVKHLAA